MYGLDPSMMVVSETSDDGDDLEHLESTEDVGVSIFIFIHGFTIYFEG